LAAGHYTIFKEGLRRSRRELWPFEVDVTAAQIKQVQWNCDTAMR